MRRFKDGEKDLEALLNGDNFQKEEEPASE